MEENEEKEKAKGFLVHIFTGAQSPFEKSVIRKICMKHGLGAYDIMNGYIPWRSKKVLHQCLIRMIKKQALSEYGAMRADPLRIAQDNSIYFSDPQKMAEAGLFNKSGILVNKETKSKELHESIIEKNYEKYSISQEEADEIVIPSIISSDYMKQRCFRRRQSLLLYRAALRREIARREGRECGELGVEELQMKSGTEVIVPRAYTNLETVKNVDDYFYEPKQ